MISFHDSLASSVDLVASVRIQHTLPPDFFDWSMIRFLNSIFVLILCSSFLGISGCRAFRNYAADTGSPMVPAGQPLNPLPVPMLDRELVMDEVSDEIDNYFAILTEERIRNVDGILSEGWIETRPKIGSSVFERWKKDSTPGFERLHATLQTIRRFAKVRVIPTAENYLVDLKVYKELEDLPQPAGSTISGRPLRSDNSLDIDRNEVFDVVSKGWIPLGRDISLEQVILKNIEARFREAVSSTQGVQGGHGNNGEMLLVQAPSLDGPPHGQIPSNRQLPYRQLPNGQIGPSNNYVEPDQYNLQIDDGTGQ